MKRFAMIGAAGYIAPRHMKAIKETGNALVAALDKNDSIGIIDSYFPDAYFFTDIERFERHLEKRKLCNDNIDYLVVCSPNYMHDFHIRFGLKMGADVICEKPVVIHPKNLEYLLQSQSMYQRKVYGILQLRLHPSLIELKNRIDKGESDFYDVDLRYITSRGRWYDYSWKGDSEKSGGIIYNIGIHFFDMLLWLFGTPITSSIHSLEIRKSSGEIIFNRANVKWFLSIDKEDLPKNVQDKGSTTYRCVKINGEEIEFSDNFTNLHTESYKKILDGHGFTIEDIKPSISLAYSLSSYKKPG